MTPKEKAIELLTKYMQIRDVFLSQAKQCAVIAVDEITESLKKNSGYTQCFIDYSYWKEVKSEIGKL